MESHSPVTTLEKEVFFSIFSLIFEAFLDYCKWFLKITAIDFSMTNEKEFCIYLKWAEEACEVNS